VKTITKDRPSRGLFQGKGAFPNQFRALKNEATIQLHHASSSGTFFLGIAPGKDAADANNRYPVTKVLLERLYNGIG
jgi:hypothetical protein